MLHHRSLQITPLEDFFLFGSLILSVNTLQHFLFSNIGWRTTSQKSSDDTFRRLLFGSVVSMYEIRGKTPQSGCETKRITSKN